MPACQGCGRPGPTRMHYLFDADGSGAFVTRHMAFCPLCYARHVSPCGRHQIPRLCMRALTPNEIGFKVKLFMACEACAHEEVRCIRPETRARLLRRIREDGELYKLINMMRSMRHAIFLPQDADGQIMLGLALTAEFYGMSVGELIFSNLGIEYCDNTMLCLQ